MALIMRVHFTRFSRWGEPLGRVHATSAVHTDALDGTDELKITCAEDISKGERIVWADHQGVCHEHIVDEVERVHGGGGVVETVATCINSVAELWDDWVDDKRPQGNVSVALTSILEGTRWGVGNCDLSTSASKTLYHESAREALTDILQTWGGELVTHIDHDGASVTARSISIVAARGRKDSPKRFTWTKDLLEVKRAVSSDNPKTRVYGYGKGVETEGGGFGRRLTFGRINGGQDYVEDATATEIWGHPGPNGALPSCCSYINDQCEDPEQLLRETRAYLERAKEPKVTYTASVIDLQAFGRAWEGVGVGDDVAIIDKGFREHGIRLHGRVSQIERDLLTGDAAVTFGTLTDSMADMWQSVSHALSGQSQHNALYDAAAGASPSWLQQLQAALNEQFNAVGTYKVETFELGTIYSNVPLDQKSGLPVRQSSNMWAVNLNGRGLRLASGLTSYGQWDWRTFLTGTSVSADLINAGTMRADRIRAGLLTDNIGKNYWDLESGEFSLSSSTTVGGKTVQSIANAAVDAQTQRDVFNRLTNGGSTQGIYLSGGKVYINASYISAGTISDRYGRNVWNLDTGALTTNSMTANNINANGTMTTGYDSSYQAKMTGGRVKFCYQGAETIELVSIPAYQGGARGGYIQACAGSTYLGLRAPKLYTALNTSEAGTIGLTKDCTLHYISKIEDAGNGLIRWWSSERSIDFLNGICTVCNFD